MPAGRGYVRDTAAARGLLQGVSPQAGGAAEPCSAAVFVLGYTLGSVWEFYLLIPNYDKIVHTLSGVFVSMLALALYCVVKPEHRLEARDRVLAALFVFFASMAVAGLWEIAEYFVNLITGRDVQRVALTGINDTMQDMIVCMIGTLAYLPLVVRACKGRKSVLTGMGEALIENNPHLKKLNQ